MFNVMNKLYDSCPIQITNKVSLQEFTVYPSTKVVNITIKLY